MLCRRALTVALSVAVLGWPALADEPLLSIGVTGSIPAEPRRNPIEMLRLPDVQRLVVTLSDGPLPRGDVERVLAPHPFTVEDLIAVGLARQEGERLWLDFNLTRVEDQRRILDVSEELGQGLAARLLEHRDELEAIAAEHRQPRDLTREFLYFALGCVSLDWDGLALTAERGWRAGAQRVIDGHAFTPWAKEVGADISLERLYWGSHNAIVDDYRLTTFGDHAALPRFGLPDLLWNSRRAFAEFDDVEAQRAAGRWVSAYSIDRTRDALAVLTRLRHASLTRSELVAATGIADSKLDALLTFLETAEYVAQTEGRYDATVVVLVEDDAALVDRIATRGREIMIEWHEEHYADVRRRLADLSPIRNGVPFERLYTQVWHFVFGIANRTLVEQGLLADPYADDRRHPGFLPAIWHESVTEQMP